MTLPPMNKILTETRRAIRISELSEGVVLQGQEGTSYCAFHTSRERAVQKAGIVDFMFHDWCDTRL